MRAALALAALGLALPQARAQDAVNLKWSLKKGDTFYNKSTVVQDMKMGFMGQDIDVTIEIGTVTRYTVKSVEGDTAVIDVTYMSAAVDPKGAVPLPGLGEMGKKVKGAALTLTLTGGREVTKVEGADKLMARFKDADEFQKQLAMGLFGEAPVREMVAMPFSLLPEKPVKVGDTWTRDEKMELQGLDVKGKDTFKLDSAAGGTAKVSMKSDLSIKAGAAGASGLPFKVKKLDMKAEKATGGYTFDMTAGRLKDSTQDVVINGSMTVDAGGQALTITMKIKMKQTVAISDKNPVTD